MLYLGVSFVAIGIGDFLNVFGSVCFGFSFFVFTVGIDEEHFVSEVSIFY